jgi:hypothetical protein
LLGRPQSSKIFTRDVVMSVVGLFSLTVLQLN